MFGLLIIEKGNVIFNYNCNTTNNVETSYYGVSTAYYGVPNILLRFFYIIPFRIVSAKSPNDGSRAPISKMMSPVRAVDCK